MVAYIARGYGLWWVHTSSGAELGVRGFKPRHHRSFFLGTKKKDSKVLDIPGAVRGKRLTQEIITASEAAGIFD